mgnify:CR=1 FL=1
MVRNIIHFLYLLIKVIFQLYDFQINFQQLLKHYQLQNQYSHNNQLLLIFIKFLKLYGNYIYQYYVT